MKERLQTNEYGIIFKLADVMKEKGYSKNKLCVNCGLRFETVQGYYKGDISRIDLYVLSKLCKELECNVQDLIEYCPEFDKLAEHND
ncbi:MAG: helix-turn-helix transcriptional regulator [Acutalibacteraceae bacterium]|nr:helix-turn-helix transcriptional regulator [Acutalibacteraceae bacterium]